MCVLPCERERWKKKGEGGGGEGKLKQLCACSQHGGEAGEILCHLHHVMSRLFVVLSVVHVQLHVQYMYKNTYMYVHIYTCTCLL